MADRDTIIPIVTLADDEAAVSRFTAALASIVEAHRGRPRRAVPAASWTVIPEMAMPPRDAFFCRNETLPASEAVGRVSAELVAPYPARASRCSPRAR